MAHKFKIKIVESKNKMKKVRSFDDIPPRWKDDDYEKLYFTEEFFKSQTREEIDEEEVKKKWKQFLSGLTMRQKSILKSFEKES